MMPAFDVCDVPIIGGGCTIIEGPGGWFEDMITAAAGAVFGFAMSLMSWIWNLITTTTTPHTDAGFVYEWASRVFGIALPITVAFLVVQLITVMLRNRSTAGIGTSVALAGTAVLATAASVPIIHLLTTAVDGVSDDLTAITFGDLEGVGERFTDLLSSVLENANAHPGMEGTDYAVLGGGSVVAGAFGFIVFGAFLVFGSLAVFAALLVRTMLLDIAVVLGPLAIMGLAWDKTHGWFKKWISLVVALIFTKLAVMIVFGLGVSGLESLSFGDDGPGIVGVLLTSTLMLFVAALVPVACFKFMSFIGDEVEAGNLQAAGAGAASRGREVASRANPAQIMGSRSPGGGSSGGGASPGGGTNSSSAPGGDRSGPSPSPDAGPGANTATGGGTPGAGTSGGGSTEAGRSDTPGRQSQADGDPSAQRPQETGTPSGAGTSPSVRAGAQGAPAATMTRTATPAGEPGGSDMQPPSSSTRSQPSSHAHDAPAAERGGPDLTRPQE